MVVININTIAKKLFHLGFSVVLLLPSYSFSQEEKIEFYGYFQNFFIFKTDRDFDPSPAFYEPWGQTVGVFGTYAEPTFKFNIDDAKKSIGIQSLWGFNLWSRNSPFSRPDEAQGKQLFIFLRQLYSDIKTPAGVVKVGYQYFADPIELFVRHWIGGVRFQSERFQIFVGQVPDQTYEGIEVFSNNFVNDTFILSFAYSQGGFLLGDGIPQVNTGFFAGLYNLFDNSVIRKPKFVSSLVFGYSYSSDNLQFLGGVVGQGGIFFKSAVDGTDEVHLGSAVQFKLAKKSKNLTLGCGVMLLSPDGGKYKDGINTGFIYSGKSMSRTLLLTEDEVIFKSDNIDLNIGEQFSAFRIIRPGLLVIDVWGDFMLSDALSISPVLGAGFSGQNLSGDFAGMIYGLEFSPVFRYMRKNLVFDFANIFFVPGKASSYFMNLIDPEKLRTFVYSLELSLKVFF